MTDLLTAIGLALVLEGVAMALFPRQMQRMMAQVQALPPSFLRGLGLVSAVAGLALVWLIRG